MFDYTIFYKSELPVEGAWEDQSWDVFISAFNSSERVNRVFDAVKSEHKYWLIQPDYHYSKDEYPDSGEVLDPDTSNESDFAKAVLSEIDVELLKSSKICIDITGFIKPYMMTLLRWLLHNDCTKYDVIYSEPGRYTKKEKTKFSDESVSEVRQTSGYLGNHSSDTSNDVLVIGSGYDDELIAHVAEFKSNTVKIQVVGFPSLRPDMYQENILNAYKASESVDSNIRSNKKVVFAPANDPFVTATVLSELIDKENARKKITNLYLSPLATKPQALGFILYYLKECLDEPVSVIYPFCEGHSRETSKGVSRIWKYTIELG